MSLRNLSRRECLNCSTYYSSLGYERIILIFLSHITTTILPTTSLLTQMATTRQTLVPVLTAFRVEPFESSHLFSLFLISSALDGILGTKIITTQILKV